MDHVQHQDSDRSASADADLVLRTRSGDVDAFGELWRRHYPSGMAVARSITSSIDPDDLVQESYTRIYQAILKGGGPNGSFRAYLFTSIRNTAAAWGRARRETPIDEMDAVPDPDSTDQAADEALDRSLTAQAFRSLPSRWQEVLWYSEIEQMKPAEIAPLLGMKPGAVSQLAFRAREGLREAWIQAHLRSTADGSDCRWTIEHLGAYSRGNLGTRDHRRLENHLDDCARCMIVAAEARDVSGRLALVLLPLVLGAVGASGYLAALQTASAPVVALAAMPSSVVEGAVVVSGATAPAGASASAAGGSTGTSAGRLSGVGALVGVGSAALVVAGVVAAAAVVPGMLPTAPATSQPSAAEAESATIPSEVSPDASMTASEPVVIEVAADEPVAPDDVADDAEDDVEDEPDAPLAPTESLAAPVIPQQPAATAPETTEPEVADPATEDPATEEPGTEEPGTEEPAPPSGTPSRGTTVFQMNVPTRTVTYDVPFSGAPDSTVRTEFGGVTQDVALDDAGDAVLALRPTWQQFCDDAVLSYAYIDGGLIGEVVAARLSELNPTSPPPGQCASDPESGEEADAPADDTTGDAEAAPAPATDEALDQPAATDETTTGETTTGETTTGETTTGEATTGEATTDETTTNETTAPDEITASPTLPAEDPVVTEATVIEAAEEVVAAE